jgi:hypothetical protein
LPEKARRFRIHRHLGFAQCSRAKSCLRQIWFMLLERMSASVAKKNLIPLLAFQVDPEMKAQTFALTDTMSYDSALLMIRLRMAKPFTLKNHFSAQPQLDQSRPFRFQNYALIACPRFNEH